MTQEIKNKVAVITGASSGNGAATARRLSLGFVLGLAALVFFGVVGTSPPRDTYLPTGANAAAVVVTVRKDFLISRAVRYSYVVRNLSGEELHNFMVGTTLSDSCPDLQELPAGWNVNSPCPGSIVVPKPWQGCVNIQEDCGGHFLEFDYPDTGHAGIPPGDSLCFSVTVAKPDSSYERAGFWIVDGAGRTHVGRVRRERAR